MAATASTRMVTTNATDTIRPEPMAIWKNETWDCLRLKRRVAQVNIVTCAAPAYLQDHGEPKTPEDLRQHRLVVLPSPSGAPPEWSFPSPYTPKRLGLKFSMLFNAAEAPIIAAAAGLGITHTADLLVAEYIARGELNLILDNYVVPGPPISLVYPSAGHQLAKVRVFSDFAADLLLRWNEVVRRWIKQPSCLPNPASAPSSAPLVR